MSAPVSYPVVVHDFCEQCQHTPLGHRGRDYATAVGSSVRATQGGEVIHAGWDDVLGNHVVIETLGIRHLYAHLSEILTESGACLETGELLGRSGTTGDPGDTSTPHLHYEERVSPYGDLNQRRPLFDDHPSELAHPLSPTRRAR